MTAFPADPAWDFALGLYRLPGVAPACLDLQERHGIDVTLMLFCLWRGSIGEEPLGERFPVIAASAREFHRASVLPIRAARLWLKGGADGLEQPVSAALYRAVLAAEIDCEHAELLMLSRQAPAPEGRRGPGPFPAAIAANLAAFFEVSGVSLAAGDRSAVAAILEAAGAASEASRVLP
jgi:uncharacterized protein (TIGR02444 family)